MKLFQFLKNLNPTIRNFLIISPFVILAFIGYGFYPHFPKEGAISQYLNNSSFYDSEELGFSFQYPNSLFVSVDPESSNRLMILPQSLKTNKDEPITAIIISVTEDYPTATALDWLESSDFDYDISEGYSYRSVGGQDAIVVNDDWIVVKTPDGNRRISIALLVKGGAKPLLNEFQQVLDTFSFK